MNLISTDTIQSAIINFIESDLQKRTPLDIENYLRHYGQLNFKTIKQCIKTLVLEGELEYTQEYGRTFIEKSFNRPYRVSDNIVLKPPELNFNGEKDDIVINILKGISFGRGSHPTTCLSLQAIDTILKSCDHRLLQTQTAMDIGTGSGVLALAASKLGVGRVYGCDIDPVSVSEAKRNISLNKLDSENIIISDTMKTNDVYDYIFANLRFPTLLDLTQCISETLVKKDSMLVLSGFKVDESKKLAQVYGERFWKKIWEKSDKGWSAMILKLYT